MEPARFGRGPVLRVSGYDPDETTAARDFAFQNPQQLPAVTLLDCFGTLRSHDIAQPPEGLIVTAISLQRLSPPID